MKHLNVIGAFLEVAGLRISKITVREGVLGGLELDFEVMPK